MLLQLICLKDLRMRPSIKFASLDADAVFKREFIVYPYSQVFFTCGFFSFTVCPVWLVIVYVELGAE